jgi:hypothetical protein
MHQNLNQKIVRGQRLLEDRSHRCLLHHNSVKKQTNANMVLKQNLVSAYFFFTWLYWYAIQPTKCIGPIPATKTILIVDHLNQPLDPEIIRWAHLLVCHLETNWILGCTQAMAHWHTFNIDMLFCHHQIPNCISLYCALLLTKELFTQEVPDLFRGGLLFLSCKTDIQALQEKVWKLKSHPTSQKEDNTKGCRLHSGKSWL